MPRKRKTAAGHAPVFRPNVRLDPSRITDRRGFYDKPTRPEWGPGAMGFDKAQAEARDRGLPKTGYRSPGMRRNEAPPSRSPKPKATRVGSDPRHPPKPVDTSKAPTQFDPGYNPGERANNPRIIASRRLRHAFTPPKGGSGGTRIK